MAWMIPAAIGAASLIGSVYSSDRNRQSAQDQIGFQREMSGTSYQRAVADMQAAGLSPMLAYSQGGASTPQGAQYQTENPLSPAVSSAVAALNMQNLSAQNEKTKAETDYVKANTIKVTQDTDLSSAQTANVRQDTLRLADQLNVMHYQKLLTEEEISHVRTLILNNNISHETLKEKLGEAKADRVIREMDIPLARNLSEAEKSAFKREVSPYLKDVGAVTGAALNVSGARRAEAAAKAMGGGLKFPRGSRGYVPH